MGARSRGRAGPYSKFSALDGRHPLQSACRDAYVEYRARRRHDAEVAYFNFALAREMGLIPKRHDDRLTAPLRRAILDTFALVIVNEYDDLNATPIPARDLMPHRYMATRYLQLQHADGLGRNSGDGRSIWNGCVRRGPCVWDVSSCGTGVTRLCPATSAQGAFFQTGNWIADYGCGTAALAEGIGAAMMSEVFHRNGIATERVLAVLALPDGLAINVRAAPSLLRPSHFFVHLHQGNRDALAAIVDLFIDRQIGNGVFPRLPEPTGRSAAQRRYGFFAEEAARTFARISAVFEREYVFCWLDWDGDNVLADGSIIDYGSVRQFGLYHRDYRFEDTDRMSTSIPEQRRKARHIAQKHAQIRDFLVRGERRPLRSFAHDPILDVFDAEFERVKRERLLIKLGFSEPQRRTLMEGDADALLRRFESDHASFERARSSQGPVKVPDGITWDAVYCMRDIVRELPARLLDALRSGDEQPCIASEDFALIGLSAYASREDRRLTAYRSRRARDFQRHYLALTERAARAEGRTLAEQLEAMIPRAAAINHSARITGDSVDHATNALLRQRRLLDAEAVDRIIRRFVAYQDLSPASATEARETPSAGSADLEDRLHARLIRLTHEYRESL